MTPDSRVNAVLHVGMPKCGSSALQTALSHTLPSAQVCYVVLRTDGSVLFGPKVKSIAETSATGYVLSANGKQLTEFTSDVKLKVSKAMRSLSQSHKKLILSNEAWGNQYTLFAEHGILPALGLQCEVVLYIRPQVARMNSAWWQWGAWTGKGFADWMRNDLPRADWSKVAASWAQVPGVTNVRVRLLPQDVVSDFFGVLDLTPPSANRSNTGLPSEVLRFFQMHPRLRPAPHRSEIEFALARRLSLGGNKTPWVMDAKSIERVIDFYRKSNVKLLDLLDRDQRIQMEEDPAWWDPAFYSQKDWSPPDSEPLSLKEVEALAEAALEAVLELDRVNRNLRRKLYLAGEWSPRVLIKKVIKQLAKWTFLKEKL